VIHSESERREPVSILPNGIDPAGSKLRGTVVG
jgi:hypothetical protein